MQALVDTMSARMGALAAAGRVTAIMRTLANTWSLSQALAPLGAWTVTLVGGILNRMFAESGAPSEDVEADMQTAARVRHAYVLY